jgi:beta-phosphoglucomutase
MSCISFSAYSVETKEVFCNREAMLRALIFDFNGIIIDDEPIHFELFQQVLAEEGISLTQSDYYARYLGYDDRGAFTAAYRADGRPLDGRQLAQLVARKAVYYQNAIRNKVTIFPGVRTLLGALAPTFPLAIASGALRHEIEAILTTAGLLSYFPVIVSAEDVKAGKPEPEIFLKALALLNAQVSDGRPIGAADCLVIEDSKEGVHGARRAGMKCLAVTNSHPAELLTEATAVVKSLEEVQISFLKQICA